MNIHEYQAKAIFQRYGIPVPRGIPVLSAADIPTAVAALATDVRVVKAQIHAGGRGKGGGVRVTRGAAAAESAARDIMGMQLVTPQTGAAGQPVRRLLIEEGADIAQELYASLVTDRTRQQVTLMASSEGGMDIEQVAAATPHKLHKLPIAPQTGLDAAAAARGLARAIGIPAGAADQAVALFTRLYRLYTECDATLVEINPLIVTPRGDLVALDAKLNFDDNAAFRHPEWRDLRDDDEESPTEREAARHDLSYIALDGTIGCMVNGAGLAMATMDIIKLYGGEPANFLDVGGGADADKVAAAFRLMLANRRLRAILVNIFGGIMRCDVIAEGITAAARQTDLRLPLIVRLEGTNVEQGKRLLAQSGLKLTTADSMADAAQKAVRAAA